MPNTQDVERQNDEWESAFQALCVSAGLSPLHREIVTAFYVEGMAVPQILVWLRRRQGAQIRLRDAKRSAQPITRASEVQQLLAVASAKLSALPEYRQAVRDFGRDLLLCVDNKPHCDDRPPDVRGVTPAGASERFQGAKIVDGRSIAQDQNLRDGVRLLVQKLRPSIYPTDASLAAG